MAEKDNKQTEVKPLAEEKTVTVTEAKAKLLNYVSLRERSDLSSI